MTKQENNPQQDLDSVSVVGSVDTSEEVTREDLLRELAAPSCIKKLPKITVSSRKGGIPDSVKKTYFIGDPQKKKISSVVNEPPTKEEPATVVDEPTDVEDESWVPTDFSAPSKQKEITQQSIPGPADTAQEEITSQEVSKLTPQDTVQESKAESLSPDIETEHEVILSVSEEDPVLEEKPVLQKNDNFEVDIETEVSLGFNPYSNLCSSLGFLIQGIHEDIRELKQGDYKFRMHLEKINDEKEE